MNWECCGSSASLEEQGTLILGCTELQLLVTVTLSQLVGHPEEGFTYQGLSWAVVPGTG